MMWGLSGVDWALMGAGFAAILGGIGSAIGITIASATISGILSEDGTKFGKLLPLAAMPGTQGIYGFIAAVLVLVFFNLLGGTAESMTLAGPVGFKIFLACMPVAFLCLISAIYQGMTAASAAGIVAADQPAPALIFPALVETYAVLSLIVTILMLIILQGAYM
ncbi:MAG: permease [Actinomycetota bacterium]|nr:permease [Actinomycetota bacterium]MDP3630752.1 permease [Actinomycetota bacterium]